MATARRYTSTEVVGRFYEENQAVAAGNQLDLMSDSVLQVDNTSGVRLTAIFDASVQDVDDSVIFHIQESNDGVDYSDHTWDIPYVILLAGANRSTGVYFDTRGMHSLRVSAIENGSAANLTGINLEWRKDQ